MSVITLLTDFGTSDVYVGAMKGVILSIAPKAQIVDITHEVAPQDITGGALALWGAFRYFPKGTVHCAVVDPGVGTERKAIAVKTQNFFFVGPDNGLLSWAVEEDGLIECVELTNPKFWLDSVSRTFHGRDIFAPVAAHLAKGLLLHEVGEPIDSLTHLPPLRAQVEEERIVAEVVHIDRFGNAITNLREEGFWDWLKNLNVKRWRATIKGFSFERLSESYAEVEPGGALLIFDSFGLLEIAVNQGSAAEKLGLGKGDLLTIEAVR